MSTSLYQSPSLSKTQLIRDRGILYKTDGTGRDTYIYNDNGGFCAVMHQPTNYAKPGTFMLPKVAQNRYKSRDKAPQIHSRSVNYRQDGSGRDSYIMHGNGGYQNPSKHQEFREAFKHSLRSYERNDSYLQSRKNSSIYKRPDVKQILMSLKGINNQLSTADQQQQDYQENNINNSTVYMNKSFTQHRNSTMNQLVNDINSGSQVDNNIGQSDSPQQQLYSQTIQHSPKLISQLASGQQSMSNILRVGQSYLNASKSLYNQYLGNADKYGVVTLGQSRNSIQAAAILLSDNPGFQQIRTLATYQKHLNDRLSQPKYLPGEGEGSLTRTTQQQQSQQLQTYNSPERTIQQQFQQTRNSIIGSTSKQHLLQSSSDPDNNQMTMSASKTNTSGMFKTNLLKKQPYKQGSHVQMIRRLNIDQINDIDIDIHDSKGVIASSHNNSKSGNKQLQSLQKGGYLDKVQLPVNANNKSSDYQ